MGLLGEKSRPYERYRLLEVLGQLRLDPAPDRGCQAAAKRCPKGRNLLLPAGTRLDSTRELQLQEMGNELVGQRLAGMKLALSQVLDLLGEQLPVEGLVLTQLSLRTQRLADPGSRRRSPRRRSVVPSGGSPWRGGLRLARQGVSWRNPPRKKRASARPAAVPVPYDTAKL